MWKPACMQPEPMWCVRRLLTFHRMIIFRAPPNHTSSSKIVLVENHDRHQNHLQSCLHAAHVVCEASADIGQTQIPHCHSFSLCVALCCTVSYLSFCYCIALSFSPCVALHCSLRCIVLQHCHTYLSFLLHCIALFPSVLHCTEVYTVTLLHCYCIASHLSPCVVLHCSLCCIFGVSYCQHR